MSDIVLVRMVAAAALVVGLPVIGLLIWAMIASDGGELGAVAGAGMAIAGLGVVL